MLMIQPKHAIMIMPNGDQWPLDIVLLQFTNQTLDTNKEGLKEPDEEEETLRLLRQALPSDVHQIFLPPDCCLLRVSRCYVGVQEMCHVYSVYHGPGVTSPHCPSQICFSFLHSSTRDPCLLTPALRTPLHILDKINIWKYKYVESDISCSITWLHPTQLENEGTIQMQNDSQFRQ